MKKKIIFIPLIALITLFNQTFTQSIKENVENKNINFFTNDNINDKENGYAAIHWAAALSNLDFFKKLENKGANIRLWSDEGKTPIHYAAANGNLKIVKYLIEEKKIPVNLNDKKNGYSPIHHAIIHKKIKTIKYLIKKGAKIKKPSIKKSEENLLDVKLKIDFRKPFIERKKTSHKKIEEYQLLKFKHNELTSLLKFIEKQKKLIKKSTKILKQAIEENNLEKLKKTFDQILKKSVIDTTIDDLKINGYTPLQFAVSGKHFNKEIAGYLLIIGSDINATTAKLKLTPLHIAILSTHQKKNEAITFLVKGVKLPITIKGKVQFKLFKANLNAQTKDGNTPLHYAVLQKSNPIVKILLKDRTIKKNIKNNKQETPLDLAKQKNLTEIIKTFNDFKIEKKEYKRPIVYKNLKLAIEKGSLKDIKYMTRKKGFNVNQIEKAGTRKGRSLIHLAVEQKKDKIVDYLIQKGAKINAKTKDREQMAPLHLSIIHFNQNIVKMLLKQPKINVNIKALQNNTPLHLAAGLNKLETFKLLLEKGANPNMKNKQGKTPLELTTPNNKKQFQNAIISQSLHKAIKKKNIKKVKQLIKAGADINYKEPSKGYTPLHQAILVESEKIVQYLLNKGAKLNIADNNRETPIDLARRTKLKKIIETLDKFKIETAIKENDLRTVKRLINKRNVNKIYIDKLLPIHLAVKQKRTKIVEYLITTGANINAKTKNENKNTPLHLAISKFTLNTDILNLLLKDKNIKINAQNGYLNTPLHQAAIMNKISLFKILLEIGADPTIKNIRKETPIDLLQEKLEKTSPNKKSIIEELEYILNLAIYNAGQTIISKLEEARTLTELVNIFKIREQIIKTIKIHKIKLKPKFETLLNLATEKVLQIIIPIIMPKLKSSIDSKNSIKLAKVIAEIGPITKSKKVTIDNFKIDAFTPLQYLISKKTFNKRIARTLLEEGANVNVNNGKTLPPLHLAIKNKNMDAVKFLVKGGIITAKITFKTDINLQDKKYGNTPLHQAVLAKSKEIVQYLLDNGANYDIKNKNGKTPFQLAPATIKEKFQKIILSQLSKEIKRNIQNKLYFNLLTTIKDKPHNTKIDDIKINKLTPLQYAVSDNFFNNGIVEALLEERSDININDGQTLPPLHLAIKNKNMDAVKFLVEGITIIDTNKQIKANINLQDKKYGNTPLHQAVLAKSKEIVQYLLNKNAKLNIENKKEETALSLAAEKKLDEIKNILLNRLRKKRKGRKFKSEELKSILKKSK